MPPRRVIRKAEVRRKREFTLHGLTLPRLQALSLAELAKLLTARARRSIQRGFNDEQKRFFLRLQATEPGKVVRTHTRDALILPEPRRPAGGDPHGQGVQGDRGPARR